MSRATSRARYRDFVSVELPSKTSSSDTQEHPRSRRRFSSQYRDWLRPHFRAIAGVAGLALLAMAFEMVLPLATRHIVDRVLLSPGVGASERRAQLHVTAACVLGLLVMAQVVEAARAYRLTRLNARLLLGLRRRLFARLIEAPLSSLGEMKVGGVVTRLSSDVDNAANLVELALIAPGVAAAKVLATLAILTWINPLLALVAVIALPIVSWLSIIWVRRARPVYRSVSDDRAAIDARVAETFGGIRVVRSFRRQRKEVRDYALGHHTIARKGLLASAIEIAVDGGWNLLIPLVSLTVLWVGGAMFLGGHGSVGDIVAFQLYAGLLLYPVWKLVFSLSQTQRGLASVEKVFEVLASGPELPDAPDAVAAPSRIESLAFEAVGFAYDGGTEVLKGVDLVVRPGSTVAIVGPSGAGKTTLTDLLVRFFDPTRGRILLNGVDIRRFTLDSYRMLAGVVQQEVFLFDGTVRENIAYGRPDASPEAVEHAARRANADAFVRALPEGYETVIGERGVKLSGGQRQRLSIARALLADPQILVLDEATSSLDTESEQLIRAALVELLRDRTTFVIAHRLSTVIHADLIIVLDNGVIREKGRHADLMQMRGMYFDMVERQRQELAS